MKNFFSMVMLSCLALQAQSQHMSIGPSIGFGHAWISNANKPQFKPNYKAGLTFVYSTSLHFAVGADAKLSLGEGYYSKNNTTNNEVEIDANYIRIPMKAIYFFGKLGDRIRPKIFAGPSFGFLMGGQYTVNTQVINATKTIWKSFDMGVIGGLGLNARIASKTWLNIDAAYTHGLTDVNKTAATDKNENRNLALNVGIAFPLGD